MKHVMGNSPNCNECRWYKEPEPWEKCTGDGWCTNKKALQIGINGKKRENPPEKEAKKWMHCCSWWEDAEYPHINYFEACTHKPDPNRSGFETLIVIDAIAKAIEEQKDLGAWWEKRRNKHE